ncbi:TPA: glycosyl transferase family 90 [Neisseria meningitidis]
MKLKPLEVYYRRLHKLRYYASHAYLEIFPYAVLKRKWSDIEQAFSLLLDDVRRYLQTRIDYCNRLEQPFNASKPTEGVSFASVGTFKRNHDSAYFFDLAEYTRYFPKEACFSYLFGDVTHVPGQPAFVKSRPIGKSNQNSVMTRLDSVRHFYVRPDPFPFEDKKDLLVWRGAAFSEQPHRVSFLEKFHNHPDCDVGCVHKVSLGKPYHQDFLTIAQQCAYRYILSIEGNDVATNLKWISASNSVCFMTHPKYETWFCEGLMIPDLHYVSLEDDYSDLNEKLAFYRSHPDAARKIVEASKEYIKPFFDKNLETIANVMVLKKYFEMSGQI